VLNKTRGFTFIELIISITILGILSAIAIPSYRGYILRSNRSEAIANLSQMAMLIEQHRALRGTYCLSATCIAGASGSDTDTFVYGESTTGAKNGTNSMGTGENYLSGFRPKQASTGAAVRYNYTAVVANNTYNLTATGIPARNVPDTFLEIDEEGVKQETPNGGGTTEYGW